MFQNILQTSLTPLSNKNEIHCWENRPFTTTWPEPRQEKPDKSKDLKRTIKKKPKRVRTSFSTDQLRLLEKTFAKNRYINAESRQELASCLKIEEKIIKVWFQNRRMKEKRDSSDSSCDSSSESFSNVSPPPSALSEQPAPEFSGRPFEGNFQTNHSEMTDYQLPNPMYSNYRSSECPNQGTCYTVPIDYAAVNIYPTQYYPSGSDYYTNIERSQYYSNSYENNWSTAFDLSYF